MDKIHFIFMVAELLSAIVGTLYIVKYRADMAARYFVFFLWFTVLVELIGTIPILINNNTNFSYLEGTLLTETSWLYNIHTVVGYIVYVTFFRFKINNIRKSKQLLWITIGFSVFSVFYFILTNDFFQVHSAIVIILGTLALVYSVFLYFLELLNSDEILQIGKTLAFYVAISSILFHLCVTPIFIFLKFFSVSKDPEFVNLYGMIVPYAIIFMYTCYTIGFLVCYRKNKSYS